MRAIFSALFLAVLCCSTSALAQECDRSDETQSGLNICAAADYKAADAKLNADYSEIMKRLSDNADARKLLQESQRAWVTFRDAECKFSSSGVEGGSIYPLVYSGCLQTLTDARVEQLGAYLKCDEGDTSCPVPAAQ
jgi:uncharacterized protein YecT (DUF1311 family)